jgi:RimJ/RimL family protein N-acetyltransferase
MVLTTERFELWQPQLSDLPDLIRLADHETTRRFLNKPAHPAKSTYERMERNAGGWAMNGYGTFYVRRKGGADIVANCGVFRSWRGFGKGMEDVPEATWIVRHDLVGQGIACEVMGAALQWFDSAHGIQRITCMITEGNSASIRVAERLGFESSDRHWGDLSDGEAPLILFERNRV